MIDTPAFGLGPLRQAELLRRARAELDLAIEQLERADGEEMRHFGD